MYFYINSVMIGCGKSDFSVIRTKIENSNLDWDKDEIMVSFYIFVVDEILNSCVCVEWIFNLLYLIICTLKPEGRDQYLSILNISSVRNYVTTKVKNPPIFYIVLKFSAVPLI